MTRTRPVEIYRSQAFASAVYRSELAREVQNLGYHIDVTGSRRALGASGLQPRAGDGVLAAAPGYRSGDARQRLNGAAAAQNIAHQSRLSKDGRSENELRAEWQARAGQLRIAIERLAEEAQGRSPLAYDTQESPADALRFSVDTIPSARQSSTAAHSRPSRFRMAWAEPNSPACAMRVSALNEAANSSTPALRYRGRRVRTPRPRWSRWSAATSTSCGRGKARTRPIANADEVQAWTTGKGLLADQAEASKLTLTATDWLTAIEGRAGSAKTTTVAAIREFAEEHGYSVHGFAPTTRAVKALSEAGLPARTVASLIENNLADPSQELWIIDESSCLRRDWSTAFFIKPAKLGRTHRLRRRPASAPRDRGGTAHLPDAAGFGLTGARLDTIRRQRDPKLREAVEFAAAGKIAERSRYSTSITASARSRISASDHRPMNTSSRMRRASEYWSSARPTTNIGNSIPRSAKP